MLNRRNVLQSTGLILAGSLVSKLGLKEAEAQTADLTLIQNASNLHKLVIADTFAGIYQSSLWSNAARATLAVSNNMKANGYDAVIRATAAKISPANLHQSLMNKPKMVSAIKIYQPTFTQTVLDRYLNQVPQTPTEITTAWNKIRAVGTVDLMLNHATGLSQMATFLNNSGFGKPTPPHTPPVRVGGGIISRPNLSLPGGRGSLGGGGGGGGYTCQDDGSLQVLVGTGLAVLAFMSAPISGPIIGAGLVLGAFLEMASYGMAAWGVGHELVC